ncbi:MAG: T9SS type A sorting domain-containing protein [Bacteroidota bacterium]
MMTQHLSLLLFFLSLFHLLPAQDLTIEASIALADDYCTYPVLDPDTDCINAPLGADSLFYRPGEDSEILITYRLTNSGTSTINMLLLTDSDQGNIIPVTAVNILPGATITTSRVFPARTTPEIITPIITATFEDASGLSYTSTGAYYLEVVSPTVETEITLWRSNDICTGHPADPTECIYNDALSMESPILGSGEVLVVRTRVTNTGISSIADYEQEIPELGRVSFPFQGTIPPGVTIVTITRLYVSDEVGTYNYEIVGDGTDLAGNPVNENTSFTLTVDCAVGDEANPTALCQDISITVGEGETVTITPQQINAGSYDECGLATGSLDQTTFTCADVGEQEVRLTVEDQAGNDHSCVATVSVQQANEVVIGPANNCVSLTRSLSGASNSFVDITDPQGNLIAAVRRNNNVGIAKIRLDYYRESTTTVGTLNEVRAGRQITFTPLDWANNTVTPVFPVDIRIYYHEGEIQALIDSTGHDPSTFQLVKDDEPCGNGYSGLNTVGLGTDYYIGGCGGATHYYETSTAELSTFYLFGYNQSPSLVGVLTTPGEGLAALPKGAKTRSLPTDDFSNDHITTSDIKVYPNPAKNILHLRNYSAPEVTILNAQGQVVLQQAYQDNDVIEIGHLPAGLYFLSTPDQAKSWIKQ